MRDSAVFRVASYIGIFCGGIFSGFLITNLVNEAAVRRFDGSIYTQYRQIGLIGSDTVAYATSPATIISTLVIVILTAKTRGRVFWLTLSALFLLLIVTLVTVTVNLPINADQLSWNVQYPPANWASVRDHWQIAHAFRTICAVSAFGLLTAAATLVRGRAEVKA